MALQDLDLSAMTDDELDTYYNRAKFDVSIAKMINNMALRTRVTKPADPELA